jgi:nitroimidazol reductase NimA-like FMN-containing flavoprotein (pyridoxamine 5'-phosphate oxidase superfamily)
MASKRSQISMTDEEMDEFLGVPRSLNVATNGPTGHPHLVAMWFGFVGGDRFSTGKLAFWTFGKSQKVMNLRRDPRISGLVEAGTTYAELRGVEIEGTARLVEGVDEVLEIALSVSTRHSGPVDERARGFLAAQARKRVGVVIDVDRVVSWDHRKLGGVY